VKIDKYKEIDWETEIDNTYIEIDVYIFALSIRNQMLVSYYDLCMLG